MAFDVAAVRAAFPEFGDAAAYPDSLIGFWAGLAQLSLDRKRWGKWYPYGLQLFIAQTVDNALKSVSFRRFFFPFLTALPLCISARENRSIPYTPLNIISSSQASFIISI